MPYDDEYLQEKPKPVSPPLEPQPEPTPLTPPTGETPPPSDQKPPGEGGGKGGSQTVAPGPGDGNVPAPGKMQPGGGTAAPPRQPDRVQAPGKGGMTTPSSETPNVSGQLPMLPDPSLGSGFADPHIRPVAGVNPWQDWAAGLLPGMVGPTGQETEAADLIRGAVSRGQQGVTGAGLPGGPEGTSPTFEATRRAFEAMTIPQIRQQRTLMGLGDSNAVTKDIAQAWAGVLPTLVESELGREERGIERGITSAFGGAQGLQGLSAQEMARRTAASQTGFGYGTGFRGIAEEANRAIYEDFLRRQGLAENLLYGPFGQANVLAGTEQQVGGLFK